MVKVNSVSDLPDHSITVERFEWAAFSLEGRGVRIGSGLRSPAALQMRGMRGRPNDNGESSFDESNFDRCFEDPCAFWRD